MRPFVSLSCSREDDRLAGKRLVRVLITPEENVSNILPELSLGRSTAPVGNHHVSENTPSASQSARPRRADLPQQKVRSQVPAANAGTSATARTRNACGRSTAGWRRGDRLNVARTSPSKPSMPRQRKRAVSRPSPCPRTLRSRNLRPHVVTQQDFFSPSLMRSAGLLRTACDLTSQPGSLLLRRLPSGGSQRPGS